MKYNLFKRKIHFKGHWGIIKELDWVNCDTHSDCARYLFNNYDVNTIDSLVEFINQRIYELKDHLNSQENADKRFGSSNYNFHVATQYIVFCGKEYFELVKKDNSYFEDIILNRKFNFNSVSIIYDFYCLYENSLEKEEVYEEYDLREECVVDETEYPGELMVGREEPRLRDISVIYSPIHKFEDYIDKDCLEEG